jgi:hypothetical protein
MALLKRKISFAYYSPGWSFENGNKEALKRSVQVAPEEYEEEMVGGLFCPGCSTNIDRTPKGKNLFANQREPFFRHLSRWKHVACYLRAKKPEGKRYDSWEEAKRAIDHEQLSIISEFLQERPVIRDEPQHIYDETSVEDIEGPLSEVPIGRHQGESFQLPSKISTVAGICRNFEVNLQKYFFLPNSTHAIKLAELITNVSELKFEILEGEQLPKLYFGRILRSWNAGAYDASTRMTRLQCAVGVPDFTLKLSNGFCLGKNINNDSEGRIVVFYGKITDNGIGLAASGLSWGEVALLPLKYNNLLIPEQR